MTRELKFRAYGKDSNEFLYIELKPNAKVQDNSWRYNNYEDWEQFTGLLDRNGKEIYEGDIIEVETCIDEEETTTYEVYWDEGTLEYALKTIKGINYDSCVGELSPSAVRVIGNIHENAEILGGEE